jgi:CYTH domain-containing protein
VAKVARELRKDKGRGTIKSTKWSESDGLLMFRGKIYVPKDRDLRCRIVEQHHNMRIATPPTTPVDSEEEYEIEVILDSQMCYNCLEYLVKWKGYDESYNQ